MTMTDTDGREFSLGRVVRNTFSAIGGNPVTILVLSLLLIIPLFLVALVTYNTVSTSDAEMAFDPVTIVAGAITVIVYIIAALILQAAIIHSSVRDLNGQTARIGESIAVGMRHAVPIILIGIVAYLGIAVGLLLLIIPGIILSLMWSVIIPVRVVENTGILETLSRSRELTAFYRWHIFGLFFAYLLLIIALSLVTTPFEVQVMSAAMSGTLSTPVLIAYLALNAFITTIQSVIGSAGTAALYYELRAVKEGIGPEALASVFD